MLNMKRTVWYTFRKVNLYFAKIFVLMSCRIKNDLWMDRFIKKYNLQFSFFSVTNRFEKQSLFERAKCKRKGAYTIGLTHCHKRVLGRDFFYIFLKEGGPNLDWKQPSLHIDNIKILQPPKKKKQQFFFTSFNLLTTRELKFIFRIRLLLR